MRCLVLLALLLVVPARAQDAPLPLLLRAAIAPEGTVWVGQRVTATVAIRTPVRFVGPPAWPDLAFSQGRAVVLPETARKTERALGRRAPGHRTAMLPPLNPRGAAAPPPRLTQPRWAR